jgi:glycosyltransferase involved in cell wall biosynthesis
MRILYFTRANSPHDQRFIEAIAANDHEVFVLRLQPLDASLGHQPGVTEIEWQGSPKRVGLVEIARIVPQVKKIIKKIHPDVIHAGPIQGPAYLAALAGAKPLLSMSWGYDMLMIAGRNSVTKGITRFTLRRSQMLVADCQAVVDKALSFGMKNTRIVKFPWGVDLDSFSPQSGEVGAKALRARLGWEDAFIVLGSRTWEPKYGMTILAEAFVEAASQEPRLRLILLGEGSQEATIRSILEEGGVMERVWFGGMVKQADLPGYYCAADLYVSPSHVDGSSISLLEALACGRPVAVSDIPGNQEWIEQDQTGRLFDDYDPEALTKAIIEAVHSTRLEEMGVNARKLAERKADWQNSVRLLMETYKKLAQEVSQYEK